MGLGFNIKMLEASVLPAIYLLYLVAAPPRWPTPVLHLAAATIVLVVVALSWAVVVDLTPAAERPFVGSSEHNSVLELVVWHNGLSRVLPGQRLFGGPAPAGWFGAPAAGGLPVLPGGRRSWRPPRAFPGPAAVPGDPAVPPGRPLLLATAGRSAAPDDPSPSASPGVPTPRRAGRLRPGDERERRGRARAVRRIRIGPPGPLRLFDDQLGGNRLAAPARAAGARRRRVGDARRIRRARSRQAVLLWGAWLLLMGGFFSATRQFQAYYLVMLAPAITAGAAIGLVTLWRAYRGGSPLGWLLPLVLYDCALVQVTLLVDATDWGDRCCPGSAGSPCSGWCCWWASAVPARRDRSRWPPRPPRSACWPCWWRRRSGQG